MKAIPFFTEDIAIAVHTATDRTHVDRVITLREFAGGQPVSLYEQENGELHARRPDGWFIEGPEVA